MSVHMGSFQWVPVGVLFISKTHQECMLPIPVLCKLKLPPPGSGG